MRTQLRSRLDPIYNPPPEPSAPVEVLGEDKQDGNEPSVHPSEPQPTPTSEPITDRRKRRRKRDTESGLREQPVDEPVPDEHTVETPGPQDSEL